MAEADLDGPIIPHVPIPTRGRPLWLQGMACVAILPLLGFIGSTGKSLWTEYRSLQKDQISVKASEIVGYVDINPSPNFARSPDDWMHDEGETTLLWAGWRETEHRWFSMAQGSLDRNRLSTPMGRDVIRAIDFPLYDEDGGRCWIRVADQARMAVFEPTEGPSLAFPLTILDKVEMVNDRIANRPVLVAYTPLSHSTSIYDSTLDGQRITLGHAGYFFDNRPVLYDRGTESLWSEQGDAMVAIAGRKKGASLKRIARLELISWASWKSNHPGGKLLIGADRSRPQPAE